MVTVLTKWFPARALGVRRPSSRSLVWSLCAVMAVVLVACGDKPSPPSTPTIVAPGPLTVVSKYVEAQNKRDLDALRSLYTEQVISITGPLGSDPETAYEIHTGRPQVLKHDSETFSSNPFVMSVSEATVLASSVSARLSHRYEALESTGLNPVTGSLRVMVRDGRIASIEITLDDDGRRKLGAVLGRVPVEIEGRWEGARLVDGESHAVVVSFRGEGPGARATMDVPELAAEGLPLMNVSYEAGVARFEVWTGGRMAVWEGRLEDEIMSGEVRRDGKAGVFRLRRQIAAFGPEALAGPLPHVEHEFLFQNGGVTLAGTLALPDQPGPRPAVILISGSGAQGRDGAISGFEIFRALSDHLARNGIVVLRYDDRGVGDSSGEPFDSTVVDFAADAAAAVEVLSRHSAVDPNRIGLLGHGEGAVAASIAAALADDVAYVVMVAGAGVDGESIVRAQNRYVLRTLEVEEEAIQRESKFTDLVFEAIRTGVGWERIEARLMESLVESLSYMPARRRMGISYMDRYIENVIDRRLRIWQSPWYRYFLEFDPASAHSEVTVPVLAVFGAGLSGPGKNE